MENSSQIPSNSGYDNKTIRRILESPYYTYAKLENGEEVIEEFLEYLKGYDGPLGIDTETTGLDPLTCKVRLIQIGTPKRALVIDLEDWRDFLNKRDVTWDSELSEIYDLLESDRPKILHNAAFDLNFLECEGVVLGGPIFDTLFASRIINNGTGAKNDLGSVVERLIGTELPKELQKADWSRFIDEEMLMYAARDAIALTHIQPILYKDLAEAKISSGVTLLDVFKLEMQCLRIITKMQLNGSPFAVEYATQLKEELVKEEDALKKAFIEALDAEIRDFSFETPEVFLPRDPDGSFNLRPKDTGRKDNGTKRYAGFNPGSSKQMGERFTQAGIVIPPKPKGGISLDQKLLSFIRPDYELVDQYMIWKESSTRVSDVEKLIKNFNPVTGRIHANYKQMGTETGRMSCAEPNLQQVPRAKKFRAAFKVAEGKKIIGGDFSQIELRVAAEFSEEANMINAYLAGRDLHTETAALMAGVKLEDVSSEQRQSAKICNFGLLYGAGAATLRKQSIAQYGLYISMERAHELVNGFRSAYPQLYKWQTEQGNSTTNGVFTLYGRRRFLFGHNDKYTTRLNSVIQGTAGDICKIALAKMWDKLQAFAFEGNAEVIGVVHDEILMTVDDGYEEMWAAELEEAMTSAGAVVLSLVPVLADVKIGQSWADTK